MHNLLFCGWLGWGLWGPISMLSSPSPSSSSSSLSKIGARMDGRLGPWDTSDGLTCCTWKKKCTLEAKPKKVIWSTYPSQRRRLWQRQLLPLRCRLLWSADAVTRTSLPRLRCDSMSSSSPFVWFVGSGGGSMPTGPGGCDFSLAKTLIKNWISEALETVFH